MVESSREELVGDYFREVQAYIPEIQHGLSLLTHDAADMEVVGELYRLFHNIKGAASQVYLQYLRRVAQLAEFLLEQALNEEKAVDPAVLAYLENTVARIFTYCANGRRDDRAEAELLRTRLLAFNELCRHQMNEGGISLCDEIIHLFEDDKFGLTRSFGQDNSRDGFEALKLVVWQIDRLIEAISSHLTEGSEGWERLLLEMRETVGSIAGHADELGMAAEGDALRDLEKLLAKTDQTGMTAHQDLTVVLGYFMSLLCMQIESMLLRSLDKAGSTTATGETTRREVTVIQDFQASIGKLLASPAAIDPQSAARISARMKRIEGLLLPGTGSGVAGPVEESADADQFLLPDSGDEMMDESFLDELLDDALAETEIPTQDEGTESFLVEEPAEEEERTEEDNLLYDIFREECEDHLVAINRSLNALEGRIDERMTLSPELREEMGAMRRAVHTLKGAAAMVGYEQLATCAHSLEDMLDWLHDHADHIGPDDLRVMATAIDLVESLSRQPESDNAAGIAGLQQMIASHLQSSHAVVPAAGEEVEPLSDRSMPSGQVLGRVIEKTDRLIEAIPGYLAEGSEGWERLLLEMRETVGSIAGHAEELGMPAEGDALRDLEKLLAKTDQTGMTVHQDLTVVLGYFMSLLCMQIESMLLRSLDKAGSMVATGETTRREVAVLQDFQASIGKLLASPAAIDPQSAARISARMKRIRDLLLPGTGSGFADPAEELADADQLLQPDSGEEMMDESFLDELLDDALAETEMPTQDEGTESFLVEEPAEEEDRTEEENLLYDIFREECEDHLVAINRSLNTLEGRIDEWMTLSPELREEMGAMRRAVHTLKGAAAMVGYEQLATCAHSLEDMLDWLHDHAGHIGPEDLRVMATAIDLIESLSRQPESDNAAGIAGLQQMIAGHLQSSHAVVPAAVEEVEPLPDESMPFESPAAPENLDFIEEVADKLEPQRIQAEEAPLSPSTGNIRVKVENLDEIIRIEGELVVARSSMEGILNEVKLSVDELQSAQGKLRRIAQELEAGFEVQSLYGFGPETVGAQEMGGRRGGSSFSEFDPIELDRYSQLNLIIRSLNELSVDINSIHAGMAGLFGELSGYVARQQLMMGAMQDKLMRTRMTPMSAISRGFFRTVRNTATQLAKNVRLTVTGDDVFMDRFIWSKITDPIMHILRNCVDHGIESTIVRREKGKPETASIRIEAEQRGSFVVLRISDDGAGIDTAALREKLQVTGLVSNPENLSDEDLLPYLFRTGLSTKDEISQISGRGVGLDVVQKNIQELRGTVHIETKAGEGTLFELRIPITLSINKAILVMAGERLYAIPLQDIVEIRNVALTEIAGEDQRLNWRDERIPVKDLSVLLQLRGPLALESMTAGGSLLLIVQGGKGHVAMMIDEVREQREIVVKDLGSYLTHVKGISGVTILGDGSLIPVLNLSELADESQSILPDGEIPQFQERELPLQILIVDDSISVRQSIARLIRHQSWRPEMAVDGVDALEKLENFQPDAIILDIEMPRMNGYELMSILRKNKKFVSIPVIMLTSRTSDKHRAKADELGVDFYLTKPFQDETFIQLLGGIRQYRRSRSLSKVG